MPARSIRVAHLMLASSSNRALSSSTTATCLPLRAARTRCLMTSLSFDVRYSVILIARTLGSSDASRRNRSTLCWNDSNGWCTIRCFASRIAWKMLPSVKQVDRRHRRVRLVAQLGDVERGDLHQVALAEHALGLEHVGLLVEPELGREPAAQGRLHRPVDLQPDHRSELALAQLDLDHLEQVLGLFLVALGDRVAGDPEHASTPRSPCRGTAGRGCSRSRRRDRRTCATCRAGRTAACRPTTAP